jgi:hypothetical protein
MQFYSVQLRKKVDVPESDVKVVTMKNGKKAAQATAQVDGMTIKLFKILSKEDAQRLG